MTEPASGPRPIPARAGIGLRAAHHAAFLQARPAVPWVEVHSENFFADGGRQLEILGEVRREHALSLHGVGLSLGSADPIDAGHLARLRRLVDRFAPALVSEHLSWSSVDGEFLNDLLPLPFTAEAVAHVAARIATVQEVLHRQILIENVSSYVNFAGADMPEWEFLVAVARRAGCLILLDVNNIYVNASNHGFDAERYLDAVPGELVAEYHVAGHTVVEADPCHRLLVDSHDAPVTAAVWDLYDAALRRIGPRPTLLEWDSRLPPLAELVRQSREADRRMRHHHALVA